MMRHCPECSGEMIGVDISGVIENEDINPELFRCRCGSLYVENAVGELTDAGPSIVRMMRDAGFEDAITATSESRLRGRESVMDVLARWRAGTEMESLAMVGFISQRMSLIENRLHSLNKRLSESLLGEPTRLETEDMLSLVDECIGLVSRGVSHG